jgi:prepilin-type N-terminal cleavage/methylation domain-containing protein/prepilin-type processing-associated H-X9-DG protein
MERSIEDCQLPSIRDNPAERGFFRRCPASTFDSHRGRGFTLVELLIVITIIGMLIALLMPAVQSAQESGRRAACLNNVRQLAAACLAHETAQGFLPAGGWGWGWVGDADRGFDYRQPGGWFYNVLPYLDQNDLHDMGKGASTQTKSIQNGLRVQTPTAITICPSRRRVQLFIWWQHTTQTNFVFPATAVARSDYAANAGDIPCEPGTIGIWSQNCGNGDGGPASIPSDSALAVLKQQVENYKATGIDYPLSTVSTASIHDGLAFTYLLGEKHLATNFYLNGQSEGDNENEYIGFNEDIARWTYNPPMQDTGGYDAYPQFGSAHSVGFNMAFCDGSTRKMSYNIDPTVHRQLGNRADGEPTQLQALELQ